MNSYLFIPSVPIGCIGAEILWELNIKTRHLAVSARYFSSMVTAKKDCHNLEERIVTAKLTANDPDVEALSDGLSKSRFGQVYQ